MAYTLYTKWWLGQPRPQVLREPHDPILVELQHLGYMTGQTVVEEAAAAVVRLWLEEATRNTPSPTKLLAPDPTGPGAMRDVFVIIGMAWRKELPLTKDGQLFKKAEGEMLDRLEGSLLVNSEVINVTALSYLMNRGLLVQTLYDEKGRVGFVATDKVWDWAAMSWSEIWADLADYLLTVQEESLAVVPYIVSAMSALPENVWLAHERLAKEYVALSGDGTGSFEHFLFIMVGFDLLEIGGLPGGGYALRPSSALRALFQGQAPKLPAPEQRFILDATFSITAPKTIPPAVLCRLERWCSERNADKVLTYKLSRASLRVALEEGDAPSDVIGFFEQHAHGELPPNVRFSLREWTTGARNARFEEVTLLRVGDADIPQLILADKTARKWIYGQITPVDLIVDKAAVAKVRKRLGEIGVAAAPGVGRPGKEGSGPRIVWQEEEPGEVVDPGLFRLKWAAK